MNSASLFLVGALSSPLTFAGSEGHAPVSMPKEFDNLKALVGTWTGTSKMGDQGKEETVSVNYKLTSAGTALEETLMAGTPHEMVSVYHKDGASIAMTHYCAMGNQPKLQLKKWSPTQVEFELTKPIGISSLKEHHMHALTLTWLDADTLRQDWRSNNNGKPAEGISFVLKRQK